ncbi:MAG: nucleotidyltransferase substrate binding protein [Planctomycetaceae bacterium]|jgi:nucleotidyltransferase substrate binding protein (TIGR01987 family)|nr:nucleotidyltransferase substrate binding protein [Planctomycetaceae bacterium]
MLDIRWKQRFDSYVDALATLDRIVNITEKRPLSEPETLGLIQAFEFTHELAWKLFKDYYEEKGFQNVVGSKDATRLALRENLIENGDVWMQMITSRNRSSHTYDSVTADEIARLILDTYVFEFRTLQNKLAGDAQ